MAKKKKNRKHQRERLPSHASQAQRTIERGAVITFGTHKGQTLGEVPVGWLLWMAGLPDEAIATALDVLGEEAA